MRSLLFVPGDSERKLEKGFSVRRRRRHRRSRGFGRAAEQGAGAQDRCGLHRRAARRDARDDLCARQRPLDRPDRRRPRGDRPGAAGRHHAAEIERRRRRAAPLGQAARRTRPKTACPTAASRSFRSSPKPHAGVLAAASYRDASPRLAGLTWGAEDLSAAIGARATRDEQRPLHRRVPAMRAP